MKVLYDHQVFTWQDFGGISRYHYELIKRLGGAAELSLKYSNNEYVRTDPLLANQVAGRPFSLSRYKLMRNFIPKKVRSRLPGARENQANALSRLRDGGYDLFHPTYYDPYFLGALNGRPFVLTVHDMIHELYPECFHLIDPVASYKRELVSKAAHIIAVSETTRKDLVDLYGVECSRVSVVYHGSSLVADGAEEELAVPKKYFLMVGTRGSYKNCYFALCALSQLLQRNPELSVVFAGGGSLSAGELRYISTLGLTGRVHQFPAGNQALRTLYKRAEAFIFPSLYEGFGIPLLEAFSCGCPVLSSGTPALREVAGDAALYFDPKSLHEFTSAAERILGESGLREKLRAAGSERLKRYSWERCAQETQAVYMRVLGRK